MRQSKNNFNNQATQFSKSADRIKAYWPDEVGDAFYRDVINQLKDEAARLETAMQTLLSKLEQLQMQIDEI